MIRLTADHNIEAIVTTIPSDEWWSTINASKETPKPIQREPMIRYIVIIIVKLPVINILDGWWCIFLNSFDQVYIKDKVKT